ncbi:hypothetical protein N8806_01510 [Flavobacteriaceae bacterium]|nr:hypothetical protein [Flavobacteriaceae bacterium]
MVIVIPMITDNKVVFGIYSICISMAIFLSYADLGFIKASIKYAGEHFARGEKEAEIKLHGFSAFILFIFTLILALLFLAFSFNPSWLISDIKNTPYLHIASQLLFIQAFASLLVVPQRFISGICQVRIEEYVFQIITLIGSSFKILSVYYFFAENRYEIVNYFLFTKIIDLLVFLVCLFIITKRYSIPISLILKSFKFDLTVFNKTKNLAFSSIFVTLMWVLYNEIDLIIIGKFLGATSVAVFALALTFSKFLRVLISIIFSPIQNRFNHFVGTRDFDGLKKILISSIRLSMPIILLTIIPIVVLSDNIIVSWVGSDYLSSSAILSLLAMNFMFSFISSPSSNLYVSLEKIKDLYLSSFIMTSVFWVGIIATISYLGLMSFAIFKVVSGFVVTLYYLRYLLKFLEIDVFSFIKLTLLEMIIPSVIQIIFLIILLPFLPETKGTLNLFIVIGVGAFATLLGFLSLYRISNYYKLEILKIYLKF